MTACASLLPWLTISPFGLHSHSVSILMKVWLSSPAKPGQQESDQAGEGSRRDLRVHALRTRKAVRDVMAPAQTTRAAGAQRHRELARRLAALERHMNAEQPSGTLPPGAPLRVVVMRPLARVSAATSDCFGLALRKPAMIRASEGTPLRSGPDRLSRGPPRTRSCCDFTSSGR
jgi:hypothetical protein